MERFWKKAENIWQTSLILAWALVFIGVGLATWIALYPQSPGVAIGLLATVAGIMSVRPDKMHPSEKFAWVAILIVLAVLEVHAIKTGDDKNNAERKEQNDRFEALRTQQEKDFEATAGGLRISIDSLKTLLGATQEVAKAVNKNLENVTGGNSYAYVFPSDIAEGNRLVTLNVHNYGKQVLSGVVVTIRRILSGSPETPPFRTDTSPAILIGSLAPNDGRTVPGKTVEPILGPTGLAQYIIYVNAQNLGTTEYLWFRRSKSGLSWDYKLEAWRHIYEKPEKGDVLVKKGDWIRYVKKTDWIEPVKQ